MFFNHQKNPKVVNTCSYSKEGDLCRLKTVKTIEKIDGKNCENYSDESLQNKLCSFMAKSIRADTLRCSQILTYKWRFVLP